MMDERTPELERLFAAANRNLADEAFVADVMAKTSKWNTPRIAMAITVCVVAAPIAWLVSAPLYEALQWLMRLLAEPLVDAGSGVVPSIVLPINSIGAVVALVFLALRTLTRRLFSGRG
jgi:hypothetical protein